MAKSQRKKMSAKKLTLILAPIMAVLMLVAILMPAILVPNYDLIMRDLIGEAGTGSGSSLFNKSSFDSVKDLEEYEKKFVREAGAEGYVLLKNSDEANKGLPIATSASNKTKVSLFSHSSVDLLAGGTGSGVSYISSNLKEALTEKNYEVNSTLWDFYESGAGKGYTRGGGAISFGGDEDWSINECPLSKLQEANVLSSAAGTKAVFVFARTGGEGRDLARYMGEGNWTSKVKQEDKDKHYLEPDSVELEIIKYLNDNFDDVIVLVNTNNAFELGWVENYPNITSVLWAPGAGGETANSLADVICGEVNPSGKLVDTFAYDAFSSPAMQNMGDIALTLNGEATGYYGVSYEEGIYVGYKYYETRYFDKVMNADKVGDYDYSQTVQYPYGYGESYTGFTWSDFSMTQPDADGNITVKVTVTNSGAKKGKEVVQVYYNPEYTQYDKENYLEKAAVNLVGFAKTGDIEPNGHEDVEITVNLYDMISYDEVGYKTYILEGGEYLLTAAADAHSAANNFLAYKEKTVADGMTAEGDKTFVGKYVKTETDSTTYAISKNNVAVTNRFGNDSTAGVSASYIDRSKYLSRQDWAGTFPKMKDATTIKSKNSERGGYTLNMPITDAQKAKLDQKGTAESANTPVTDQEAGAKMLALKENNDNLQLLSMRGKGFIDEGWNEIISRITVSELTTLINRAGYRTEGFSSINKPVSKDLDGPSGLNNMVGHYPYSITYPAEVNLAASWNVDISYVWGELVGEDGLRENVKASGWYAPAMNIHRTPFAGRNFEYFSEDAYLSGVFGTEAVKGAASKGMFSYIKHFALNDQEDHRAENGLATFSNEQAMREIYLKPFQMCVERAGNVKTKYFENREEKTAETPACTAVMSSFNRVGTTWAGGDYRLLTQVLREEWGFNGIVLTDYSQGATSWMHNGQMLRAGGDLSLAQYNLGTVSLNNNALKYYAQQAAKHTCYTVVNSNTMNYLDLGTPFAYYYIILILVGLLALGFTAWGVTTIVLRFISEKKALTETSQPGGENGESENAKE